MLSNFPFTILGSQSEVPVQNTQHLLEGNQHQWKTTYCHREICSRFELQTLLGKSLQIRGLSTIQQSEKEPQIPKDLKN